MTYIWIRSTANWEDPEAVEAQLPPEMRAKAELWNESLTVPFHAFRARVREIARISLANVDGARCSAWEEIPTGCLVLPVDDDDWFAPEVGRTLEAAVPGEAYRWTSTFIEVPLDFGHRLGLLRRRLRPATPPKWVCTTNNYALVKRDGVEPLLRSHVLASEWVEAQPPGRVKVIERPLSAMNRTLGSQTSLGYGRDGLTRAQLLRKLRAYRRLYRRLDLSGIEWARPYVAMMAELMDDVEVR